MQDASFNTLKRVQTMIPCKWDFRNTTTSLEIIALVGEDQESVGRVNDFTQKTNQY